MKTRIIAILTVGVLGVCALPTHATTNAPNAETHPLGLLPSSSKPGIYRGTLMPAPRRPLKILEALPDTVDNGAGLPAVGDQGNQNACGPFALAYYYKTYQEGREHAWDLSVPSHQFSPAFLYNQVAPFNEGTTFDEIFNILLDQGCATWETMPYHDVTYGQWPPYATFSNAIPYRIQSYARLGDGMTPGIVNAMRERLANGDLCVIGIYVWRPSATTPGRFEQLDSSNFLYEMPADADMVRAGGHAVAVVGYDDALFGGKGGFKIVNQWGTGWGQRGFAYVSYQFVQSSAFDIYVMDDRMNYQPQATARFTLHHTFWNWKYDNVTVTLGVGSTDAPLWSKTILTGLEYEDLMVDMSVDITEAVAWLPPSTTNRWWLRVDDYDGSIFGVPDIGTLTRFEIRANGTNESANAVMPLTGSVAVAPLFAFLPCGERPATNYYVNDAALEGDLYCTAPGDDANDGLSPATAKRSLQAMLDAYVLKAGDTVWVDAGTYDVNTGIRITQLDRGAPGRDLRIIGAVTLNGEIATLLNGNAGVDTVLSLTDGARFIRLENLWIKGGTNGVACDGSWSYDASGFSLHNVRVTDSTRYGCAVESASVDLNRCLIRGCGDNGLHCRRATVTADRIVVDGGTTATPIVLDAGSLWGYRLVLRDSVLMASGAGRRCVSFNSGCTVDSRGYNLLFATNGAVVGFTPEWTDLATDPFFVDRSNGDYHLRSSAGRWSPNTNGVAGLWVVDNADSPCIDIGDPTAAVGDEPAPNGGRRNIGIYGGTPWASQSPACRQLAVVSPNGGEVWKGMHEVVWSAWGAGWAANETVALDYWDGSTWRPLDAASTNVPFNRGRFAWDLNAAGVVFGSDVLVRVVANADAAASDESDGTLTIQGGRTYYVNDGTTSNDYYCTAVGDDAANTGQSSNAPKATVQAILNAYDLEAGDVVYVDTGHYDLATGIVIASSDAGSAMGQVRIAGSPKGTVLHCANATMTAISVSASYVTVEGLRCEGGSGISCSASFCEVLKCVCRGAGMIDVGIRIWDNGRVENTICIGHATGIKVANGTQVLLKNNTVYSGGNGIAGNTPAVSQQRLLNNIVWARGSGNACLTSWRGYSDYNLFFSSDTAIMATATENQSCVTLAEWRASSGNDLHSLAIDPLFADAVNGDFHVRSTAGRWDPTGAVWVVDASNSVAIDAGDPADSVREESQPNGGRIELGAYGGTTEASRSPPGRLLTLIAPTRGDVWRGEQTVRWSAAGDGWGDGDTVMLQYSADNGATWQNATTNGVPCRSGAFTWDTTRVANGAEYRMRGICEQDGGIDALSDGYFYVHNGGLAYYVNDASTNDDVYCTVAGDDAYTGLSPAAPKASVQAVLATYDLEPGDVVYIDSGSYTLPSDIVIAAKDSGDSSGYVRFVGAASLAGTMFNRNTAAAGAACWALRGCSYISLERFRCTGATGGYGIYINDATSVAIDAAKCFGNKSGFYVESSLDVSVTHCEFCDNTLYGVDNTRAQTILLNNTISANGSAGIKGYFPIPNNVFKGVSALRNNIVMADGASATCLETSGTPFSDYNVFWPTNGAAAYRQSNIALTLGAWRDKTGQDTHSLVADPLFADSAGHDFHPQSSGGRWSPTNGTWVIDLTSSPCMDAGDPNDAVSREPAPNGGRVNAGAYGGTAEASKSTQNRVLSLVSPVGGEVWRGYQTIRWLVSSAGWDADDLVVIEGSRDGGSTWFGIETNGVSYRQGACSWDTSETPDSPLCRVRVSCKSDPSVSSATANNLLIHNRFMNYYVNDNSTTNDVYCSQPGNDANDGVTPATPKGSVQAILAAGQLQPGDTVYVDTGNYLLSSDILLDSRVQGTAIAPIRFVGSTHPSGSVMNRDSTVRDAACWNLQGCMYVVLESLRCTGASRGNGIYIEGNSVDSACTVRGTVCYGNNQGIAANIPASIIENCICFDNSSYGIRVRPSFPASGLIVRNSTCYGNGLAELSVYSCTLRGNILVADGVGRKCFDVISPALDSDYNEYWATNGATLGLWGGTLSQWQTLSDLDLHSLVSDPLFANASNRDFHVRSKAGRWDPLSGAFVSDSMDSPAIDVGDPLSSVGQEPSPNGQLINLGAYGGTGEASKSPTAKALRLLAPVGGEVWTDVRPIRWVPEGADWSVAADSVRIDLSADGGTNWQSLVQSPGVGVGVGEWQWDTTAFPRGSAFRVRISALADVSIQDASAADFSVSNSTTRYYVNDADTVNDRWCTALGDDANDGLTPASPKATIQAVVNQYVLSGNAIVYVDTGLYSLSNQILIGSADSGVRLLGAGTSPPCISILDRGVTNCATGTCLALSGNVDLIFEGFVIRNVSNAVANIDNGAHTLRILNNRMQGCGMTLTTSSPLAGDLDIRGNTCTFIRIAGHLSRVRQNTVWPEGLSLDNANDGSEIRHNILVAKGSGRACIAWPGLPAASVAEDYNLLSAQAGASLVSCGKDAATLYASLPDWRAEAGKDVHSMVTEPRFAGTAAWDFHLRSTGGRYSTATGKPPTDSDAWLMDTDSSLALDAGDPSVSVGMETVPNGGVIELGAFGGTLEASRTLPVGRTLSILAPHGGAIWNGIQAVETRASGTDWDETDTIRLECSLDDGAWQTVPGATSVPYTGTRFWWDTRSVPNAYGYRVRAVCNDDGSVSDVSDGYIAIANAGFGPWHVCVATNGQDDVLNGIAARPFRTIAHGIAVVQGQSNAVVEVRVANGWYHGCLSTKPFVNLLGGYAAADWSRSVRDSATVLDGMGFGSVIVCGDDVLIEGFTIVNGSGRTGNGGGGVLCNGSSPIIRFNRIVGNSGYNFGGGIRVDGSSALIMCNVIASNSASYGGGIAVLSGSPLIANNILAANDASSKGDGIYIHYSQPTIVNSTFMDNCGHGIYWNAGTTAPIVVNCILWGNGDDLYKATATYSCIEDNDTGTGNIHIDPKLTTNYHLRVGSPCIDAGDDSVVQAGWTDIDGQMRSRFAHVDIGAHESMKPRDSDEDGLPDSWMTNCFGHATGLTNDHSRAQDDADGDGMINSAEYTADTHPTNRDSVLSLISISPQGDGVRIDWKGGIQATQYVECRPTLTGTTQTWMAIFTNPPPTPITNFVIDAGATNATLFYRIEAGR